MMLNNLTLKMMEYYKGDPKRIQHFTKVHAYAKLIATLEKVSDEMLFMIETAAIVHDIGIRLCEEKYGKCGGRLQEQEGPALAKEMLETLGFEQSVTERVCYLVGHHHT